MSPPAEAPTRIILATREAHQTFQERMTLLSNVDYSIEEYGGRILTAVSDTSDTQQALLTLLNWASRDIQPSEKDIVVSAVIELMETVRRQLSLFPEIKHGQERYLFDRWLGTGDMVVFRVPY